MLAARMATNAMGMTMAPTSLATFDTPARPVMKAFQTSYLQCRGVEHLARRHKRWDTGLA